MTDKEKTVNSLVDRIFESMSNPDSAKGYILVLLSKGHVITLQQIEGDRLCIGVLPKDENNL